MEKITPGALYIVSTPIGHLGDITFRAVHILNSVNLIAAEDTRKSKILLSHYNIHTPMISFHSYNQKQQTPRLLRRLKENESIALISDAGTPGISDPAHMLVTNCTKQNITVIPIPGPAAFLAALVVSGLPTHSFLFEGFLPLKKGRKKRMTKLVEESRTMVFYESPHRIAKTVDEFIEYFGDRSCVMGREITKKFEEFFRGRLRELQSQINKRPPKGEIVLIVAGNTDEYV